MATQLVFDPRLYDLMRQTAITTLQEGLVELITNSHDAYISVENMEGGENLNSKPINIFSDKLERTLIVIDNAKGMTSDEMTNKLLTVGSLTADEFTRGLIGRGAKDISNIGDVEFVAIKDNKLSMCKIYQNLTGEILIADRDVTQTDRSTYKILGNGMYVKIQVDTVVEFPDEINLFKSMRNNFFLRKMYTESSHYVNLNSKRITYSFPEADEVLDIEFTVPNYPEAIATFKVYRSKEVIPNPLTDLEMQYGILVSSSQSTYECGGLYAHNSLYSSDYRWNPNMKMIYGELKCDYIDKLAREITTVGKSVENPFLIFDPNRRNGLHKKHPFTNSLYEIPYRWLEILLHKLQDEKDDFLITGEDIEQMLHGLETMLSDNLPVETTVYTWRSKTDQENLNAMSGHINKININKDIVNIDDNMLEQIKNGEKVIPVANTNYDSRAKFDIKITDNKDMIKPFEVFFYNDKISIRINAHDESIKPFVSFHEDTHKIDIEGEGALVSVNKVLQDAVVYMLTRRTLMSNATPTVSDTNNYNEILEIQNNAKQQMRSYSYSVFKSIYEKFHT